MESLSVSLLFQCKNAETASVQWNKYCTVYTDGTMGTIIYVSHHGSVYEGSTVVVCFSAWAPGRPG